MTSAASRSRLATMLAAGLAREGAESMAVSIDGGFGQLALAAITARPAGTARAVEAAAWVRRAEADGVENIVTLFTGGMSADELDAATELHMAIARRSA